MPKKRTRDASTRPPAGLGNFVKKYQSTAAAAGKSEEARQKMVREMVEMALKKEGARLRIVEHSLADPKGKPKITDLEFSDPRAAALRLERFCNIRFAIPFWLCPCPVFIPFRLLPFIWFGFFLIFCDVNVCSATLTCFYIGI
jgi:hypothetical protein